MERHVAVIAATPEFIYGFHLPWPGLGVVIPTAKGLPVGGRVASVGFLRKPLVFFSWQVVEHEQMQLIT